MAMKRAHASGRLPKRSAAKGPNLMAGYSAARIKQLEKDLANVGRLLDAEIEGNKQLYDRLMLAIDGGRPPAGVLSTLDALAPLAKAAEVASDQQEEGCSVAVPLRHLRDAARTLAWVREGQTAPRKAKR